MIWKVIHMYYEMPITEGQTAPNPFRETVKLEPLFFGQLAFKNLLAVKGMWSSTRIKAANVSETSNEVVLGRDIMTPYLCTGKGHYFIKRTT